MAKAKADIRSLARSHTDTAIRTLVGIMNQSKASPAARVAAAVAVLDRGWGKPQQALDLTHDVGDTLAELMREIDGRSRFRPLGLVDKETVSKSH